MAAAAIHLGDFGAGRSALQALEGVQRGEDAAYLAALLLRAEVGDPMRARAALLRAVHAFPASAFLWDRLAAATHDAAGGEGVGAARLRAASKCLGPPPLEAPRMRTAAAVHLAAGRYLKVSQPRRPSALTLFGRLPARRSARYCLTRAVLLPAFFRPRPPLEWPGSAGRQRFG
jgi:hypothetical protein